MTEKEEYEIKLLFRAFNWTLFMYGEQELRENPGLLLLEMEALRNDDSFIESSSKVFKDYDKMIKENPNFLNKFSFERPPKREEIK